MIYKDKKPCDTVNGIKDCLNTDYALTFYCVSSNAGEIAPSYSLTNRELGLITNGKGTTHEYAQASAFGEMFERLFNMAFIRFGAATPIDLGIDYPYHSYRRIEVHAQLKQIVSQELGDDARVNIMTELFMDLIDAYYGKVLDKIPCITFENTYKAPIFFPVPIADILIGTNGMAAGNTLEEAFVQAFSEIMERKVIKDLNAGIIIPDLVKKSQQDLPVLNRFLDSFNEKENILFKVFTFERFYHFPVIALLVVDIKRKKYKIKFGAHCTLSYALERCVTEFVQGAEAQDYSKWNSIKRACLSNTGENMAIFVDGSGTISGIALENLLLAKNTYGTDWRPQSNREAFSRITASQTNIYTSINKTSPAVALQLFIPGWSFMFWPNESELKQFIDNYKMIRQLIQFIKSNEKTVDNTSKIYHLLSKRYIPSTSLNQIVNFLCPVQLQYLKQIKIEDLSLVVNAANNDYQALSDYFYKKSEERPNDEYSHYAAIYAYYMRHNDQVPHPINVLFTENIRKCVEKDFANGFNFLLNLDYCQKCPRKGLENCIHEEKKRVCRLIVENENISY